MLGKVRETAVTSHRQSPGLLLNYSELPGTVSSRLGPHFRMQWNAEDLEAMKQASHVHSKRPAEAFQCDIDKKQEDATPLIRELAALWITPHYQRLETLRSNQMS